MEISWTTFVFEIINFLVLVWLLKRFLYKPVLNVIEKRKKHVQKTLDEAGQAKQEALRLKEEYDQRLVKWSQEKESQRKQLAAEIESEREKHLSALHKALEKEREAEKARQAQAWKQELKTVQRQAIENATSFAAHFLSRLSDSHLEERIISAFCEDFSQLDEEKTKKIRNTMTDVDEIKVCSAYPLQGEDRRRIESLMGKMLSESHPPIRFEVHPDLVAGLEATMGSLVLRASVKDELRYFSGELPNA